MNHFYTMQVGDLLLCPLQREDIQRLRLLRNQNRWCFIYSEKISPEEQSRWFERYLQQEGDYVFSVFYRDCWVGSVSLYNVSNGQAEFGRLLIDRQAVGRRGLGRMVTDQLCALGFASLGLSGIHLEVYEDNFPALRTYERAGFVRCGKTVDSTGRILIQMERTAMPSVKELSNEE